MRSPNNNNDNNAGAVNGDGEVNNNNVNNDNNFGVRPALPYCQMSVLSKAGPCDKAKESCS
ncbi:MAG: hypothetical protein K6E30_10260, partial [Lachnospiraceae bacterium]|nr:hypothetical protein [Lachnospiraceae bacterium]